MKIGIIVAMEKELKQLRSIIENEKNEQHNGKEFFIGNIGVNEIIAQQCGIGKVNSTIGAVELINNFRPELIISTGVAGGADINLNPTDVVVSTACTYHDAYCGNECEYGQILGMPAKFQTPKDLIEKALTLEGDIHAGLIVSGEWFVDSKDKMRDILSKFPEAKAVDMESCSIAQTCHIYNVPFVSFRIISDVPLKDTNASQYYDFWQRIADGSFTVTKHFLEKL